MTFQSIGELAAKVVDPWTWWRNALDGKVGPIHHEPEQGFFRVRAEGSRGQWEPVAIWRDEDGTWLAYRAGREVKDVERLWTYACRNPIEHAAYEKAMAGEGFVDEPPAPTIGDNSGSMDPLEAIRVELAGEIEQVSEFIKQPVKSQADADRCGIWAKRLTDLAKRADSARVVEKEPHLAASRAVDDRWRDPIADAKDWAAKAKKHVEAFLIAQKRKAEEIARKAREEAEKLRAEAERLARENQEAADEGLPVTQQHVDERAELLAKAQEAEKAAEVRNASAGRTGARVSIRTINVGVVVDYEKAAIALVRMKHKDMLAEIDRLAKNAATKNFPFDGMEIRQEEKAV